MANYLVHCDGCGKPTIVENPQSFICDHCNYDECTIAERPTRPEPVTGEDADLFEELWSGAIGPDEFEQDGVGNRI